MSLALTILNCAERCEQVLKTCTQPDTQFERTIIVAIAAMQVAATSVILEGYAGAEALSLVMRCGQQARDALARQNLDQTLIRHCADSCERTVSLCAAALAASHPRG